MEALFLENTTLKKIEKKLLRISKLSIVFTKLISKINIVVKLTDHKSNFCQVKCQFCNFAGKIEDHNWNHEV